MRLARVLGFGGGERSAVYYECRRCGTATDGEHDACSVCGSGGIAAYEL